jgi:hypothetical protein
MMVHLPHLSIELPEESFFDCESLEKFYCPQSIKTIEKKYFNR